MSRVISIHPEAKEDIVNAARTLRTVNTRAADQFVDLVEKYLGLIEKNPLAFGFLSGDVPRSDNPQVSLCHRLLCRR